MDASPLLTAVSTAFVRPLRYPLDADQRLFWPFLAGALVAALLTLAITRTLSGKTVLGLFTPRVWLHKSSLLDIKLLFVKPIVKALFFTPWMFSAFVIASWTVAQLDGWRGVPGPTQLSTWQISLIYTVVLFLCWDASRFLVHWLAHKLPFLWELHKVHHSAEVMTPLTIYRSHPLESLLFQLRGLVVTGIVTGIFFHLFRSRALQYEYVGVNAIGFVLNVIGGNLRHSHVWLRYPSWLERFLISPAQHQLHHSSVLESCHSNYGSFLAVWDRLFGTLLLSRDKGRPLRFGLPRHELNHSPRGLFSALFLPLVAIGRRALPGTRPR